MKIAIKTCPTCKRAFYPDFYQNGIVFSHNKFMITIDFILDVLNTLKNSGSLVQTIQDKLRLLSKLDGVDEGVIETDINNNSVKIEKLVIAVSSLIGKVMKMHSLS